jgi:hypothetical protein
MHKNLRKEWKNLHEARVMMREIRKELNELNRMMAIAWKETMQPAK